MVLFQTFYRFSYLSLGRNVYLSRRLLDVCNTDVYNPIANGHNHIKIEVFYLIVFYHLRQLSQILRQLVLLSVLPLKHY